MYHARCCLLVAEVKPDASSLMEMAERDDDDGIHPLTMKSGCSYGGEYEINQGFSSPR